MMARERKRGAEIAERAHATVKEGLEEDLKRAQTELIKAREALAEAPVGPLVAPS